MFAAPIMTFLLDGKSAIIFTCLVGTPLIITLALVYARSIRIGELLLLTIPDLAAIPIGSAMLGAASPKILLITTGLILLAFMLWQFAIRRISPPVLPLWTAVPIGFITGVALGATSLGGAVLGIYAFLRRWDKNTTMAMLNIMAAVTMLFCVFVQWKQGLYTAEILNNALLPAASSVAGVLISIPVLRRIDPKLFRLLLLSMITISGFVLLTKGLLLP